MMRQPSIAITEWRVFNPCGLRAICWYLLITAVLVATVAHGSAGFSYSLDDAYIHLALAQHIAQGTYGINAGETTSPASSVLWPFLLVPFCRFGVQAWAPLLLNVVGGLGTCLLLGRFVHRTFREKWQASSEAMKWLLALLIVLAANLPSLALLGMEHTLQVLLVAGCAFGIMEAYFSRRMPLWALLSAALAPSLRYEDLAFTLALCIVCWLQQRRSAAVAVGAVSLLPLVSLGVFLHAHGLSYLPNSVIVKGGVISAHPHLFPGMPLLDHFLTIVAVNAEGYVLVWDRWPITVFLIMLCVQLWRTRKVPARRNALAGALAGLVLIMAVGPYGYFFRYDVAYRLFAFLIVFAIASGYRWFGRLQAVGLAVLASFVYAYATCLTPASAWGTAHEQKQMQRFSHDFYRQNVAINDLGWVSYDARNRFYILDVAGLASNEASRQRVKDAAWLDAIVQKHNAGLAMIYPYWFQSIPADWQTVAVLHRYGDGNNQVTFYATQLGNVAQIRKSLQDFSVDLPSGSWLSYPNEQH